MKANILKVICFIIVTLMIMPVVALTVQSEEANTEDFDSLTRTVKKPGGVGKPPKDQAPIVTIVEPAGAYVQGVEMTIVVTVEDEDVNPVADISMDDVPTYNTENSVTIDISTWEDQSQHIIYASYKDSNNKIGSDTHYVIKGEEPPAIKYALIVGISDYQYINDLNYCDEDAADWYNYLVNDEGYDPMNICVLGDSDQTAYPKYDGLATKTNIITELNNLVSNKNPTDTIIFTFSGHGGAGLRNLQYFCCYDSSLYDFSGDVLDSEFADIIGNTNAGNIFIFLDSCNSGGFIPELKSNNPSPGVVYMTTTCNAKGYGYDEPSYNNGAWTFWFLDAGLLQGLSGCDDMESNFDWAYSYYPYKQKHDQPQEWDEDTNAYFYL